MPKDLFKPETIQKEIAASAAAIYVIKNNELIHEWYVGSHHFTQAQEKFSLIRSSKHRSAIYERKIKSIDDRSLTS